MGAPRLGKSLSKVKGCCVVSLAGLSFFFSFFELRLLSFFELGSGDYILFDAVAFAGLGASGEYLLPEGGVGLP